MTFFSILDFSAFFIHVTRCVEYWNIHLRCIIWHFRFNQFVDMGLHITTIVGISCTSELIVFNGVRCINKTLFGCFDVHSIFRLILSHFQLRNFDCRCITRNHAFFNILTIYVRNFNDFTITNITRFIIRCLNQLICRNCNSAPFRSHSCMS